ncbi:MAG: trypsin-like peptidase domain-containing protein [Candidatus Hydrogenedentes bacterium]|nr:trypsin-like peptidase domain-containing protein [Candidatus Hydrogenedentota bacterium]
MSKHITKKVILTLCLWMAFFHKTEADILEEIENRFVEIHTKVGPSVVSIEREALVSGFGIDRDELFRRFGLPVPDKEVAPDSKTPQTPEIKQKVYGTGSGFLYSKEGYIVTNNHVIEGAEKITVKTYSGKKYTAEIVATDSESDLAVLKINPEEDLLPAILGDSDSLKVGQFVAAIGSARGLEGSVSYGHISALGRENLRDLQIQGLTFQHLIQTDAGINLGNSGGPLVNIRGEVIGVNVALMMGANRIGFAIPINTVKKVVPQLIEQGKVSRGYLGVAVTDVERFYNALDLPEPRGAFVKKVQEDTPAFHAGLQVYDVILKIEDKDIENAQDLVNTVSSYPPGTEVKLQVWRNGNVVPFVVVLGERSLALASSKLPIKPKFFGMSLGELTDKDREQLDLGEEIKGVLIDSIEPGSPADDAGLIPGDVIMEIQKKTVDSLEKAKKFFTEIASQQKPILIRYKRTNQDPDITVINFAE